MEGLYGNSITGICELCWEDCGECVETIVDGVSEADCTLCSGDLFLDENDSCVAYCAAGTYPATSPTAECLACDYPCEECTSATVCTLCQDGAGYLLNGGCIDPCTDGYYEDEDTRQCELCNGECVTCHGPENSNCDSC